MSKIVVFGGDGFIGRHLVTKLAASPDNKIVVFDRFSSYQIGEQHFFSKYPNVNIVFGNFFNRSEVADVLNQVDYVFHLVSTTTPATSINDPLIDVDTNIRSSVELFELCADKEVKRVIFLSSGGAVYGDADSEQIDELSVPRPISPYAIGKLTIEHYLRYFKTHHNLDYIVYRVGNPYGPGQNLHGKQGVIPIFLSNVFDNKPLIIFGDGSMIRDYLYISDLVNMVVGSYNKDHEYSEYNIGSGMGASINELLRIIEASVGHKITKKHIETPDTYVKEISLKIDRFIGEFKIKPSVSLEDGISKTWSYVREKQ